VNGERKEFLSVTQLPARVVGEEAAWLLGFAMLDVISEATARLERYDREIERAVPGWRWERAVRALMSLRGMALLHAATLVAELGDFNRFEHPGQLMGYLGLVPSEHTTGNWGRFRSVS
jgi:transposase